MTRKPVQIVGLNKGGASTDGQSVHFEVLVEDGPPVWLKFGHEALPQFIDALLSWAEAGRLRREGKPVPDPIGPVATHMELGLMTDHPGHLKLTIELSGSMRVRVPLDPAAQQFLLKQLTELPARLHRSGSERPN